MEQNEDVRIDLHISKNIYSVTYKQAGLIDLEFARFEAKVKRILAGEIPDRVNVPEA